jgi:[ribosomal protein S5]-alanine N-acetyltransferase
MMEWYPHPFSRAESQHWIEWNQRLYRERGFGLWALERLGSGELLGDCGLVPQHIDDRDEIEVGWHVKREMWGQGFAPEAARAVLQHAFETLRVPYVISLIRPENVNSLRVAEKLGMYVWKETVHGATQWRHLVYRLDRAPGG